jgi:DNA primase
MEQEWVDFRVIKAAVSMQMLIDHYGVKGLRKSSSELRGRCPIHRGEGERTFHVNLSKNVFQCFSCKAKGNVLDFVSAMEHCNIREAALKLHSWFAVGESNQAPTATRVEQREESATDVSINPVLPFTLRVDTTHDYGLSRGLSKETLEQFGAGLCLSKGTFSGRFVIPLHNDLDELVGYAGRSLDDTDPRYLFPSREKGFYKSRLLFNLHRALENFVPKDPVVILEGFFGCFKVKQAGYAGISLFGSSLSKEQEEMICNHFKKVVLLFDGDAAGRAATDDCLQRLGRRLWVRAISLPDNVQPDQLATEEIQTRLVSL